MMKRANKNESRETQFRLRPFSRGLLKCFNMLRSNCAVSAAGWGALASIPSVAFAGPSGESVAAGAVNVTRPQANRTEINQSSQNAIVNWNTFSIEGNEYVLIQQPNSSSTILNRVIGSQQSRILGQLQANGRVFLVNPNGVLVAPGASIDVGAITMSALDIGDDDFMAGNYVFSGDPNTSAGVENGGIITTADGGYVVLAGDYVNNTGVITATLGTVVLAAGEQVTLDIDNDGLVGFAVDEATVSELAGVENAGDIIADGGRVLMTASVANDLVATAVNNQGLVQAHRIEEQGGEIFLTGYGGDVTHAGTIDVSGENGHGGGTAIIYGDRDVMIEANSQIIATGSGEGDGGSVRVIADGTLNFKADAEIDVGDRGFLELSGHKGLAIRGAVNVGEGGELLIDPAILTIQNTGNSPSSSSEGSYGGSCPTTACVGKGFIEGELNNGATVKIVASDEIRSSGGPFTISSSGSSEGAGRLELKIATVIAGGDTNCNAFGVCVGGTPTLMADPDGNINLADVSINMFGDLDVSAGSLVGNVNLGTITAGNVNITAGSTAGNITVGQVSALSSSFTPGELIGGGGGVGIAAASTDLALTALGGDITVNGNLSLLGSFTTRVDLKANTTSGNLTVNGNIFTSASFGDATIRLEAGGNVNVSGNLTAIGSTADVSASAGNLNIGGTTRARAFSDTATVQMDATGSITTGAVSAEGTSGRVDLFGNNVTTNGNISVSGTSAARFSALANNNLSINGLVNVTEGGGGFARAYFAANNGIATINGGVNVIAGPGGSASVMFGSSEGSPINNLSINNRVFASGPLGSQINANVKNAIRTAGNGLLQADTVAVRTNGSLPTIDIDTRASQIFVDVLGGAPNLTVNNSTHVRPTSIFLNGGNFRSATVLSNFNLNFFGAFQAQNLLVGAPNGIVGFNDPVFINGVNPFPATAPDLELFRIMATRGLIPPGHGPNVQILGGNGINMTSPFVLGGANPFIKLFSNRGFNTPGLTTNASNMLAVFNPINLASPILFGDTPLIPPLGTLGFFNSANIQGLPDNGGTTVVIGEKGFALPFLSGPVTIGPDAIDLGDRNMFIISRGQVTGDDLVTTNGIFEIIGLADTNVFQIPIIQEIGDGETDADGEEDDEDDILGDASGEGGDGEEGSISEESNSESMECAA